MTNPTLITIPFANTGTKNSIPETGAPEPQMATLQAGFPAITQQPVAAGGIPPERADFNGILNLYGQHIVHINKGLPYEYDPEFATAIGGYPLNARVMLTNGDIVQCTSDGNSNNPNSNMTGWKSSKAKFSVSSIEDMMLIPDSQNGDIVFVSSKQGGWFEYNTSSALKNDGVLTFSGWERIIVNNTYTPEMAGCASDGTTDDALNLDKLMYLLESENIKGSVFFGSNTFINSDIPKTGKMEFRVSEKIGIRLVNNVDLIIPSGVSIKFGIVFTNCQTSLLSAMYRVNSTDWYGTGQLRNIKIHGGGILDFTQTGGMTTQYWGNRYAVHFGSALSIDLTGIELKGGQFTNVVCSSKWGSNQNIYNNKFIDVFNDSPHSEDHSTLYLLSPNSHAYNNTFELNSIGGRAIACACELHNSNQSFYGNIIKNFWSGVYFTAMEAPWEHASGDIIENQHAYDNIAYCSTRFAWVDGTGNVKIKSFSCHDNTLNYVNYPTDPELATIGRTRGYRGTHFFDVVAATSTVTDYVYGAIDQFEIYNNTQSYVSQTNADYSAFLVMSAIFGNNLKIRRNTISANRLAFVSGSISINSNHKLNGLEFIDNNIDSSKATTENQFNLSVYSCSNMTIDIKLNGRLAHASSGSSYMSMTMVDGANSTGNTIKIKCNAKDVNKRTGVWFEPYGSSSAFNAENAFCVPYNCLFSSYAQGGVNLVYSTTTTQTIGASHGEILSLDWFPTTDKQTFLPRFATREMRTGLAATLSFRAESNQDLSSLIGNVTVPIQLYRNI